MESFFAQQLVNCGFVSTDGKLIGWLDYFDDGLRVYENSLEIITGLDGKIYNLSNSDRRYNRRSTGMYRFRDLTKSC